VNAAISSIHSHFGKCVIGLGYLGIRCARQATARSVTGMPPAKADIYPTEQQVSSLVTRMGRRVHGQAAEAAQ
jgi:hypothetical protein